MLFSFFLSLQPPPSPRCSLPSPTKKNLHSKPLRTFLCNVHEKRTTNLTFLSLKTWRTQRKFSGSRESNLVQKTISEREQKIFRASLFKTGFLLNSPGFFRASYWNKRASSGLRFERGKYPNSDSSWNIKFIGYLWQIHAKK